MNKSTSAVCICHLIQVSETSVCVCSAVRAQTLRGSPARGASSEAAKGARSQLIAFPHCSPWAWEPAERRGEGLSESVISGDLRHSHRVSVLLPVPTLTTHQIPYFPFICVSLTVTATSKQHIVSTQ